MSVHVQADIGGARRQTFPLGRRECRAINQCFFVNSRGMRCPNEYTKFCEATDAHQAGWYCIRHDPTRDARAAQAPPHPAVADDEEEEEEEDEDEEEEEGGEMARTLTPAEQHVTAMRRAQMHAERDDEGEGIDLENLSDRHSDSFSDEFERGDVDDVDDVED